MPLVTDGRGPFPVWAEVTSYEIVDLPAGSARTFERAGDREKLFISRGTCRIAGLPEAVAGGNVVDLDDLPASNEPPQFIVEATEDAVVVRVAGAWGTELGGSGFFGARRSDDPQDRGDPVHYPKETNFDSHYHDCDEYWIIISGRGVAVSEDTPYEVGPGDCVVTGMGDHHDFPIVREPVHAIFFETTLEGEKRRGHLWNHTHGQGVPRRGR